VCDASDPEQVARIFRETAPDVVYQLTSESFGGQDLKLIPNFVRNDLLAPLNVLIEAAAHGARVVLAGSFEEPDGSLAPTPSSPYAAAKWAAGGYARMISALHGLEVVSLRLMMVYGPRQKAYKVVPYVINKLLRDEPAELSACERHLDWIYIDDVVAALAAAGEKPWRDCGAIDIGSGRMVRLRDMLQTVADMMGKQHLVRFGAAAQRKMEREGAADNSRAGDILGWAPATPFDQGIRKTIDYYASR
jgi:UDP-glucose 4-epimerase